MSSHQLAAVAAPPAAATEAFAPFGDRVSAAIYNYDRANPHVATSGLLREGGIAEAKALGFRTIVDLRGPTEGTAEEAAAATAAELDYVNIPVTTILPTASQVAALAEIVEDPLARPVLVHCKSANRVGAAWALYRISRGVPPKFALEEGRTVGLAGSREQALLEHLKLRKVAF